MSSSRHYQTPSSHTHKAKLGRHWGVWPGSKVVIPCRLRKGFFGKGKPEKLHPELHEGVCSTDSLAEPGVHDGESVTWVFFYIIKHVKQVFLLSNQNFSSCRKQWKHYFLLHIPTNILQIAECTMDAKYFHPSQMCDVWREDKVQFFLRGDLGY